MFKVIEFEDSGDGGGLSVIRSEWMTPRRKECMWPPLKLQSKFNKCLTTKINPDENWIVYPVKRILYETDDLIKAREKCKRAESESELTTTDVEEKHIKRKRKIHPVIRSDSEESEDFINIRYPTPPQYLLCSNGQSETKSAVNTTSVKPVHKLTVEPQPERDSKDNSPYFTTLRNDSTPKLLRDFNVDSPISRHSPCSIESHSILAPSPSPTVTSLQSNLLQKPVLDKINASLDLIAKYLGDIKSEIRELKETQNYILVRTTAANVVVSLPEDIDLPLKTLADLQKLQNWLEGEENKVNLSDNLSYIGGNKTSTITRRILERVFTNSLAVQCNWTGKNNKTGLKDLRIIKVIIGAVRKNKISERATDSEIIDTITSWFRFAKDRDGGRDNRRTQRVSQ